ncbi:hypothetical protein VPH35_074093 [Triticum aestivum]
MPSRMPRRRSPSPPPPGAASTSHPPPPPPPPLPCSPPPTAASRATSPPLPSTTSRSPPPPAAACTSRPPPLHDPTPSPSLHQQLQPPQPPPVPPRRTYTPINLPEGRYFDGDGQLFNDKDGEGLSYSRPQPPPCEDTEQAVRIEALSPPTPFPSVSALMPTGLLIKYFLRVDADGLFHTYPHRGGPFKSLEETQEAIDTYHANRIKIKYLGELSKEDRYVWHKLYWRDGTRKNSKEALDAMMNLDPTLEVVKCLLDKHNEEHHLFEDLAYEVKEVVSYKAHFPENDSQYECRSFSHLNVLAKRGLNDDGNLLFIEITCTDGEFEEYALTCLSAVSSDDNGECCECGDDVKHPTGVEYKKGEAKPHGRCKCINRPISDEAFNKFIVVRDEDSLEAEEARVRRQFRIRSIADGHGARGKYIVPAKRVQA